MKSDTTVSRQLHSVCIDKINWALEICRTKSGQNIPLPNLRFRQLGRVAGVCRFIFPTKTGEVIINPDFFKNHYDDMLNDTVPHEVAHFAATFIYGRQAYNHGGYWKHVMSWLGIPSAERCHEYSLEGVKTRTVQKPFKYNCRCAGLDHWQTQYIHNKILRGTNYRCRKCKTRLVYVGMKNGNSFISRPVEQIEITSPIPQTPIILPVMVNPRLPLNLTNVGSIINPFANKPLPPARFTVVPKMIGGVLTNVRVPVEA